VAHLACTAPISALAAPLTFDWSTMNEIQLGR
jgi:hypothetical protein